MPIHYEHDEHIVRITIDRAERKNALDLAHFVDLATCWVRFRDDPDAWVAIITGVGDSYCAGGDLRDYIPKVPALRAALDRGDSSFEGVRIDGEMDSTLRRLRIYKPIIAAVNGPCLAGGMEMLGGIDIRLACPEATFGVMEPRWGLIAGGGTTARLPRQLGWPAAMELLLTADAIPAERARELGLINEIVPRTGLLDRAYEWARRITKNGPVGVAGTKESALRGFAAGSLAEAYAIEEEITRRVFDSEDAQEGLRAFAEKRAPVWRNR